MEIETGKVSDAQITQPPNPNLKPVPSLSHVISAKEQIQMASMLKRRPIPNIKNRSMNDLKVIPPLPKSLSVNDAQLGVVDVNAPLPLAESQYAQSAFL